MGEQNKIYLSTSEHSVIWVKIVSVPSIFKIYELFLGLSSVRLNALHHMI